MTAVPPPSEAQLARGRELGERLHAIAADISAWIDEVPADNADRLERAQLYGRRVLASLQSAGVDLGTLALAIAEVP